MNDSRNIADSSSRNTNPSASVSSSPDTVLLGPPMLTPNPLSNSGSHLNIETVDVFDHSSQQVPQDDMMKTHANDANMHHQMQHPQSNNPQGDAVANIGTTMYSNNWEVSNPLANNTSSGTSVSVSNPITPNANTASNTSNRTHHNALTPPSVLPVGGIRVPNPFNVGKNNQYSYDGNNTGSKSTQNPISNNSNTNTDASMQMTSHNYANSGGYQQNSNTLSSGNAIHAPNASNDNNSANNRRQKRLERNRESARLSRRRRKQYLEILEDRVSALSVQMDEGRIKHAADAVPTILSLRQDKIKDMEMEWDKYWKVLSLDKMSLEDNHNEKSGESKDVDGEQEEKKESCASPTPETVASSLPLSMSSKQILEQQDSDLYTLLSRSTNNLRVVAAFQTQQFKSYVFPPHVRFIQWLTLQNDVYFLGGRAASERLSAARIGERMLNAGNDRVTPAHGMWPLLCNEINLSYDQEERVRSFQRNTLTRPNSWLDYRHSTQASKNVNDNLYNCLLSFSQLSKEREENTILRILTPEQRTKLHVWIRKKKKLLDKQNVQPQKDQPQQTSSEQMEKIRHFLKQKLLKLPKEHKLNVSQNYHDATNIYIINNHLESVLKSPTVPAPQPIVNRRVHLKQLSRRPPFESLGGSGNNNNNKDDEQGKNGLNRDRSYSSSGSLKRCASGISIHERDRSSSISSANDVNGNNHSVAVSPEAAQAASHAEVAEALKPAGITLSERTFVPPMDGNVGGVRTDVMMKPVNNNHIQPQMQPSHVHYPNNKMHKGMNAVATPVNTHAQMDQRMEPTWNNWEDNTYNNVAKESFIPTIPISSNSNVNTAPLSNADRHEQNIIQNFYESSHQQEQQQPQQQVSNMRNSVSVPSILHSTNAHMNIVPEEDEFNANEEVDDYLLDLTNDNDWAIGGFDEQ